MLRFATPVELVWRSTINRGRAIGVRREGGCVIRAHSQVALRRAALTLFAPLLSCCCGCLLGPPQDDASAADFPFIDQSGNFTFDNATALTLDSSAEERFSGELTSSSDVDLYSLGVLAPGDALFVDVRRTSGDLDAVAAVFDRRENIHAFNDDRAADSSDLDPLLDIIIRGPQGE